MTYNSESEFETKVKTDPVTPSLNPQAGTDRPLQPARPVKKCVVIRNLNNGNKIHLLMSPVDFKKAGTTR